MAKLSNQKKERQTVNAIEYLANLPDSYLIPDIPVGDKGISFDGHISVMEDDSETKESLIGRVPVQVKGTEVEHFTEGVRSFSFELADYRNFFNSDGVLLLVGEVKPNGETKLFYKALLALEINELLQRFNKQKQRVIELRPLDETRLYDVCYKFLAEQTLQSRELVTHKPFQIDDFRELRLTSMTYSPSLDESLEKIFDHDFTMYGVKNQAHFPLKRIRIGSINVRKDNVIFSDMKNEYRILTDIEVKQNVTAYTLEKSFILEISNNDGVFKLNYEILDFNTLAAQLKVVPMLISLFSGNKISFRGNYIQLDSQKETLEGFRERYECLLELERTFELLGIDKTTLIEQECDDQLGEELEWLILRVLKNDVRGFSFGETKRGIFNFKVGKHLVLLFYNSTAKQRIVSVFSDEVAASELYMVDEGDGEEYRHSIYISLSEESLAKGININSQAICNSFDQIDPFSSNTVSDFTNNFCLKCINAFIKSGKRELLDIAENIYAKSNGQANVNNEYILINKLQIKLWRDGSLTDEENQLLYQKKMQAIKEENAELSFCVSVLLKNLDESRFFFNLMDKELQDFYMMLPIYKLYESVNPVTE
ncbi:hypothetical protein PUW24_00655 (plasmid) [Paenibacillus urinalis]|uniref:DUF4365 domain-containing protein n=1 Tax=Paenibacillus urinalis TaxID=521520 RepID=A0AAX3N608_9BACL|nr:MULTISPECIES: DUF4365 domain-containing protein [Paenibacillus]MCM3130574.1 DUF4365 domain-containing protein [Paenibacillus sp. MER 78]WDH85266.1 hypothetical protein PUW23_25870 [Paenibacillus urinalis]WDH95100.1 hypothetical protein PUW24_00655 [Paenibacillus urinalis]WDI05255.1 hypothetical protein PUW25_26910 [Paenibacillus urinalis]